MKVLATDPFINTATAESPAGTHCQARLSLGFANDAGTTRLFERSHFGPLRIQKPLYPEGPQVCHAIVVHPPGGVVGGDELAITARVGDDAHAFLTTPGAAKWYKANGHVSRQTVRLEVGAGASLEWLPQETIFFNAAHVRLDTSITLAANANYIGCEILCFGRSASGEIFESGRIAQNTAIRRDGKLIWFEHGDLSGDSTSMTSPLALDGKTVCATLLSVGAAAPASLITALREAAAPCLNDADLFGVTQVKSVTVVRYLGNSSETARQLMIGAWQQLRPHLLGRAAVVPRIWNT